MYDAVLFDLDGTLYDSAPELTAALNLTLDQVNLRRADRDEARSWIGMGVRALLHEALSHLQRREGTLTVDHLMPLFTRNYHAVNGRLGALYAGVAETLAALRARGVPMGVLTNKEGAFARQLLRSQGMHRHFQVSVFGDTLAHRKPEPQTVEHCLESLRIPRARVLMVGDSEIDVLTARNAGIAVWAVPYGYRKTAQVQALGADRVIESFVDLLPAMRSRTPIWDNRARAGEE